MLAVLDQPSLLSDSMPMWNTQQLYLICIYCHHPVNYWLAQICSTYDLSFSLHQYICSISIAKCTQRAALSIAHEYILLIMHTPEVFDYNSGYTE